ncbi:mannitol dehydrogenase family protein [Aurantimonas marianensis]|uniref:Mannitol dehydrogenase family protein n=1 Tax=Aurantimonas marianensis TaxID=2920428 RepID=A0A9X2KIR3_9HYPH|nr:mannitol dehydrogenase family protein [Aurantimonas marianensis]MCP3055872.1 mannitol dehydrogenase family protein [Aurantimonas marianensis]
MSRLCYKTLENLPPAVARPAYDPRATTAGIVHLGVGAFHRAHQAVYLDDLLAGDPQWAVAGASLRRADMRDALAPQDNLFTVAIRSGEVSQLRVIGSLKTILVAREDPEALLAALCDPAIRIVSLTVTERGYCHDPATGDLDPDHSDIKTDLDAPTRPTSAPGLLAEALRRRRAAGLAPFTVMPCDNLPENGPTAHRIVAQYAALRDGDLARFVERDVAFAGTMVDRIVPATSEDDIARISEALGVRDAWPVVTEPFSQWVIEDRFPTGRPDFASVGAEMVADVEPYERMKLRMLNGAHSTLAYLGYLAGYETVSETMADPAYERLVRELMTDEVMPTLEMPGTDLAAYRDALIARFHNPALKHRTWQIAMDGSQKLPQRLLGTVRDRLAAGRPVDGLALGVAAWMRYVTGIDENGAPIEVKDPLAERLRAIGAEAGRDPAKLAAAYLGVEAVFDRDLRDHEGFAGAVTAALASLLQRGAAATVAMENLK